MKSSMAFPPIIAGFSRAFVNTKNEMKKFPWVRIQCEVGAEGKRRQTHEGKPGKDAVEGLIDELDVYPEFAREAVGRSVDVV